MKYSFGVSKVIQANGQEYHNSKVVRMASSHTDINYTLSIINHHYLNYYIQEIKKLIQGEELKYQKLPLPINKYDAYPTEEQNHSKIDEIYVKPITNYLEINISDEPDFEQHPDMSIIVTKDWTYPVEYDHNTSNLAIHLNANPNNKKIETSELLDFLLFTKKELSTEEQYKYLRTDEVVKPDLTYWKYYFSGGHHKKSLNNDRKIIDIKNTDQHGVYLALQEKTFLIKNEEPSITSSTINLTKQPKPQHTIKKSKWIPMFPNHWTPQEVIDRISEAYDNAKYKVGSRNSWIGETKDGVKIEFYNSINGQEAPKANILSAFPILE
jgi:hypothetical protein